MEELLNETLQSLSSMQIANEGVLLEGDPSHELIAQSQQDLGLLLVGSRNYGPIRGALAGSTSRALLHHAQCPVTIVPRGVEDIFAGAAAQLSEAG